MSRSAWGNGLNVGTSLEVPAENLFEGRIGNIINYSGLFQTGANYKQFDIVYSSGSRLFHYARENMTYGGGVSILDDKRFAFLPNEAGPNAHYIIDTFNRPDDINATLQVGHIIDISGTTGDSDGQYKILDIQKNYTSTTVENLTGAAIKIWGTSPSSYIENFENTGSYVVSLSVINATPESNPDLWASREFFFDADYGSSVNFRANNIRHEYGNGYYILQPRGINSLSFEASLKFNNRTNREANAITHFVENHLGQLESDSSSPNLRYKQGISGFRWEGNSMFNPYRSVENESKTFYCTDFNHSLNFENSNDINLVLRNLDTSTLRKSEQLYIRKADTYDDAVFYEKNDVAFYTGNHEYYYWHSDASSSNKDPAEIKNNFNERENYSQDLNTGYWTRDFFWKPSLSLSVSHKPRMEEISVGGGYTQVYSDGINENLLNLDLQFNNRSDEEAYAILHFLEQKLGCRPFNFVPPAPYNRKKNFVCQEWTHTYNYKDNHSISAKFEEYPFNVDAEGYTNLITDSILEEGELVFSSPASFSVEGDGERIVPGEVSKVRVKLKNIGDTPITLNSASATAKNVGIFNILGQVGSNVPFVPYDLDREDYIYTLPSVSFPYNLGGKTIKLSKSYTPGISDGGQMFTVVTGYPGNYKPEQVNGVSNSFFQNNRRQIKSGINENINTFYRDSSYYVVDEFFKKNTKSTMSGGEEGYLDVVFGGISQSNLYVALQANADSIVDNAGNTIVVDLSNTYFYADLEIQSSSRYSPQVGQLKVFVSSIK